MIYLLDTNTCIRYINGRSPLLRARFLSISSDDDIVVCSTVKAELYYGVAKSNNPIQTLAKQQEFLKRFNSLPFEDKAAAVYGPLRARLEKLGTPIGPLDMLIAAIAIAHNLTLVTHNTAEFSRVETSKLKIGKYNPA